MGVLFMVMIRGMGVFMDLISRFAWCTYGYLGIHSSTYAVTVITYVAPTAITSATAVVTAISACVACY